MISEECNVVLLKKLTPKLKDSRSFTILYVGNLNFEKALIVLGASVNLMLFFCFSAITYWDIKPTSISLQLADRSVKYPLGIIEDVLVKVDRFILTVYIS